MSELPHQPTTFSAARKEAIQRDDEECVFCGRTRTEHQEQPQTDEDLHVHHILPRRKNGPDAPQNLITVCADCHKTVEDVTNKLLAGLNSRVDSRQQPPALSEERRDQVVEIFRKYQAWRGLGTRRYDITRLAKEHHQLRESLQKMKALLDANGISLATDPIETITPTEDLVSWLPRYKHLIVEGNDIPDHMKSHSTTEKTAEESDQ